VVERTTERQAKPMRINMFESYYDIDYHRLEEAKFGRTAARAVRGAVAGAAVYLVVVIVRDIVARKKVESILKINFRMIPAPLHFRLCSKGRSFKI